MKTEIETYKSIINPFTDRVGEQVLTTPQQVWADPYGAPVPTDHSTQYLTALTLTHECRKENLDAVINYLDRCELPIAALGVLRVSKKFPTLLTRARFQTWFRKHSEFFGIQSNVSQSNTA